MTYSYSITILSRSGNDVDVRLLNLMHILSKLYFKKSLFARERGVISATLHIQGVISCNKYIERCEYKIHASKINLVKMITKFLDISKDEFEITLMPLRNSQYFTAMLGYCSKDHNLSHYIEKLHNVSRCDLIEGRKVYNLYFRRLK